MKKSIPAVLGLVTTVVVAPAWVVCGVIVLLIIVGYY